MFSHYNNNQIPAVFLHQKKNILIPSLQKSDEPLFLGYHDGTGFFGLDFSLHGEKGKDKNKPFGLTKKQQKARYSKKRDSKSAGKQREN
ncbi:MAG: hypothetical protein LBC68_13125, partial [Prevotellaceae bacterium]|nr:hypothetical protein [Prevotellaceae bacterium]